MEKNLFHLKYNLKDLIWSPISRHSTCTKYVSQARSGKTNFEKDFLGTHIETSPFQKFLLGIGSGFKSITDPRRGDMVAVMGESTGTRAFEYVKSKMLESEEGRKILEEKPRISSASIDLKKLERMPEGTLGKAYSNFLGKYKYSPDERLAVRFVDDIELAYVAQRYREAHDLFHTILYMPTNMLGEVTVKWVEALQTGLPMCVTGALFGPLRLAPKFVRTYSTTPVVTLDQEVSFSLEDEFKPKHHSGRMKWNQTALPEDIENAIISFLMKENSIHLFDEAVKARSSFARLSIPIEGLKKLELMKSSRAKIFKKLSNSNLNEEKLNQILEKKMRVLERVIEGCNRPKTFDKKASLLYLMARAPIEYAIVDKVLYEIVKKNPNFKPERICDFGSGVGTVMWAVYNLWGKSIKEFCGVDVSEEMNKMAASIIEQQIKNELPRSFVQRQILPTEDITFDIVVSSFSLSQTKNFNERMEILQSLWNKTNKYLVIIENGTEGGFQIITDARNLILQYSCAVNYRSHVLSPCPHEFMCPKTAKKIKSKCTFQVKYKDLKINKERFGSDVFSYVIFEKRNRNKNDKQWPRIVSKVKLRKKQAIIQMCTSEGNLTTVNFTKFKHGQNVYRCARKSVQGDSLPVSLTYSINDEKCKCYKDCEKGDESNQDTKESEIIRDPVQ